MKTIKSITLAVAALVLFTVCISSSQNNYKKVKSCLIESTHQGYRSMLSDYIF